jgi:hypothetical protein
MPFYKQLKKPSRSTRGSRKEQERVRTIDRLLKLRKALREEIPARTLDEKPPDRYLEYSRF